MYDTIEKTESQSQHQKAKNDLMRYTRGKTPVYKSK
jgi:hypothetical protein